MKKLVLVLVLLFGLTLAACVPSDDTTTGGSTTDASTTESSTTEAVSEPADPYDPGAKIQWMNPLPTNRSNGGNGLPLIDPLLLHL